jgi:hypothetical protein
MIKHGFGDFQAHAEALQAGCHRPCEDHAEPNLPPRKSYQGGLSSWTIR